MSKRHTTTAIDLAFEWAPDNAIRIWSEPNLERDPSPTASAGEPSDSEDHETTELLAAAGVIRRARFLERSRVDSTRPTAWQEAPIATRIVRLNSPSRWLAARGFADPIPDDVKQFSQDFLLPIDREASSADSQ
jgi:hypothetical protein